MAQSPRRALAVIALLALGWIGLGLIVRNSYYQLMLTVVPIWAVLGLSWNILSGYSGLVSFGHASFFGIGAYTVTIALVQFDLTPWFGIPLAMVAGVIAGVVIGYPTFRLRGHYFALSMLAYPLALLYIFQWLGYQEVTLPMKREAPGWYMQFADFRVYLVLAVGMMVLALLISLKIERSRFGMALLAIKQNEPAAEAAGIDTLAWKMRAIMLSGAIAAAAGGLYAVVLLVVTPEDVFGLLTSSQALIVTFVGGVGTLWGPVIGAAVLIPLSKFLQAELGDIVPGIQGVVLGIAIIAIVLLAPEGIYWRIRDRWRRGRAVAEPEAAPSRAAVVPLPRQPRAPADAQAVLTVRDLSKSFGGLRAVEGVSFEVIEGELLGIIGPNGAGKTTLFNILNGFLPPSRGQMLFAGQDLAGLKTNRICRLGIGRTFQVVRSFARMSVLQNVVVGAYAKETTDARAFEAARLALARVHLSHCAERVAGSLTNKELRLMELARALAGQPRLLLMDEPLAGLGAAEVEEMLDVVRGIAAEGVTIVIIEHTMRAMVRLVDRFVVLNQGTVLAEGGPAEVTRNPRVIEAYLGTKWAALRAEA